MTARIWRLHYERVLLVGAILLVAGTSAWSCWQRSALGALRREPVAVKFVGNDYVSAGEVVAIDDVVAWTAPRSQSAGVGWRYEVFTPPTLFYDAARKSLALVSASAERTEQRKLELELIEVRRQPYPLQLVGCLGKPGDYVAVLSSPGLPETMLARAGDRLESLGVRLASIEMTKSPLPGEEKGIGWELAPRAVLRDEHTDEEIVLATGAQRFTDKLTAVFRRTTAGADRELEVEEGGVLRAGSATCRIVSLQLNPPIARLERLADGAVVEEFALSPRSSPAVDKELPPATETAGRVVTAEVPR